VLQSVEICYSVVLVECCVDTTVFTRVLRVHHNSFIRRTNPYATPLIHT